MINSQQQSQSLRTESPRQADLALSPSVIHHDGQRHDSWGANVTVLSLLSGASGPGCVSNDVTHLTDRVKRLTLYFFTGAVCAARLAVLSDDDGDDETVKSERRKPVLCTRNGR